METKKKIYAVLLGLQIIVIWIASSLTMLIPVFFMQGEKTIYNTKYENLAELANDNMVLIEDNFFRENILMPPNDVKIVYDIKIDNKNNMANYKNDAVSYEYYTYNFNIPESGILTTLDIECTTKLKSYNIDFNSSSSYNGYKYKNFDDEYYIDCDTCYLIVEFDFQNEDYFTASDIRKNELTIIRSLIDNIIKL